MIAHQVGKHNTAVDLIAKALAIKPDYVEAHNNLGLAFKELGKLDEAMASYHKALAIKPDYAEVHNNLGIALQALGRLDEAIQSYELTELSDSRVRTLECLYRLNRYEDFYQRLDELITTDNTNLRVAAISSFVSHQLGRDDPYPFCKTPLDFIRMGHVGDNTGNPDKLINDVVEEIRHRDAVWEPPGISTKFGFQTRDNLFLNPSGSLAGLDRIIKAQIASYYSEFKETACLFTELWPEETHLRGWFVRLLKNGHQGAHIHPDGWLSGVVYLKLPSGLTGDEGAIEFHLNGRYRPVLNEEVKKIKHRPEAGQIVLFPSSLHHNTVPISSDAERWSIAFDLLPD